VPYVPKLSVVVPVYNEAESLPTLYEELVKALESQPGGVEFVLVDDGSTDGSLELMRAMERDDPRMRVVALDGNFGQSAAFAAGFEAARGEFTATMDADLQNDPADIPRMLEFFDRADVVNGVRVRRSDGFSKRLSSKIANGFRNWMNEENVTDVGCSLRVMRTSFVRRVKLYRGMHRFLPTLLRIEGARLIEVPVAHRPRRYGRSKYGIADRLFVGIADVFAVRWMQLRALHWREKS
jgi:glycosyltransferase involved in cell wall biosynthesis